MTLGWRTGQRTELGLLRWRLRVHASCMESTGAKVWTAISVITGVGVAVGGAVLSGWVSDCKTALSGAKGLFGSFYIAPHGFSRGGCQTLVDAAAGGVVNLTGEIAGVACLVAVAIIFLTNRTPKDAKASSTPPPP